MDLGHAVSLPARAVRVGLALWMGAFLGCTAPEPAPTPAPADQAGAARPYDQGRESLRRLDGIAARRQLEAAVAATPDDALAWAALAAAYALLGEDAAARKAAEKALELRAPLPEKDRLAVEAQAYAAQNELEAAIAAGAALVAADPAAVDHVFWLATAQSHHGEPQEALATIEGLCRVSPAAALDPRIEIATASALLDLGDLRSSRAAAERAVAAAEAAGQAMLAARARLWQAIVLQEQGGRAAAAAVGATLAEARKTFSSSGDRRGLALILHLEGTSLQDQGNLKNAEKLLTDALAIYRQLGERRGQADLLVILSAVVFDQGRAAESARLREEGLTLYSEIGAHYEMAMVEIEIGLGYQQRGDFDSALRSYRKASKLVTDAGAAELEELVDSNTAEILLERGEPKRAGELFQRSLAYSREQQDDARIAINILRLGQLHALGGDLVLARDHYQQAAFGHGHPGDPIGEETRLALADLLLSEGDAAAAERLALGAEEVLLMVGAEPLASRAGSLLTRALLVRHKLAAARATSKQASGLAKGTDTYELELTAEIAAALVAARADGQPAAALARLAALEADARRRGLVRLAGLAAAAAGEIAAGRG